MLVFIDTDLKRNMAEHPDDWMVDGNRILVEGKSVAPNGYTDGNGDEKPPRPKRAFRQPCSTRKGVRGNRTLTCDGDRSTVR